MLLAVVAVVAAGIYISTRLNDDIRRHVEKTLADHYGKHGLDVTIEGARRIEGEGIRVTGISITDPTMDAAHAELARIDELFVVTDADLISLVQGKATAREIIVRHPTIRTVLDAQGNWSISKLLPLPKFSDRAVPVRVEQAQVEVFDAREASRPPWKFRDISFRLSQQRIAATTDTASANEQSPASNERHIQGALVSDHIGQVAFEGTYEATTGHWRVKGGAGDVRLSNELCDSLPTFAADKTRSLEYLHGHARISFEAAKDDNAAMGAKFAVHAEIKEGQITDPRLPYPLSDVHLIADANNHGITISRFTASHGQTTLEMTGRIDGFTPQSPATLTAKIRKLTLERWDRITGTPLEKLWYDYQPHGVIDVDAKLTYDGTRWHPNMLVTCRDVGFTFRKFPYPLTRSTGTLHLIGKDLKIALKAHSGKQPVEISGQFENVGPDAIGRVHIEAARLPVDSKVLAALPPAAADLIERLRGAGHFGFAADLWRNQPSERIHHRYKIQLQKCAIKFDRFPYPIRNVTGKIDVVDDHWTFYDLESVDQRRHISGWGTKKRPDAGGLFTLHFVATDIALDNQLRSALEPSLQQLWDQLDPRGTIDQIKVDVNHTPGQSTADLVVRLEKDVRGGLRRVASSRAPTASVSITPEFFPYRFDKLSGTAIYVSRQQRVTFKGLRAEHKNTRIASGGYCDIGQNGGWTFRLVKASVDRLKVDHDLTRALPSGLRDALTDLKPTGMLNLRGDFQMSQTHNQSPLAASWNVEVGTLRSNLTAGDLLLENVSGAARFTGQSRGDQFQSRAELALDAVTYEDFQFTDVRGPMWLKNDQILMGAIIPKATANERPRNITAKSYGGVVAADCRVTFGRIPNYAIQATLSAADLRQFANDKLPGKQNIEGKVYAEVRLSGTSQGIHTMKGDGKFKVRKGKMYDLPVLLAMLKLLRVREPSTTAFNRCDITFTVRGKYIRMNHIDFKGDAISLFGNGEMNLDGDLRMKLSAVLGREDFNLPIIRDLITNVGQQIMTIHVDGTIDDPKVTNKPFPALNRALEQIQGPAEPTPADASWSKRTRDYLRRNVPWPSG